ncbi:MAG: GH39 family glycosyl hydrolase [Fimbriimonas sp.]
MIRIGDVRSQPLKHPWREGIAMGRAFELMRADAQAHLTLVQRTMKYRYCRFHGLFHEDMAVAARLEDGSLAYQWGQMDKLIDFLLSIGLRPFAELGPMPKALSSGPTVFFHWQMNVTPPRNWSEWGDLVRAFAEHAIERYGIEEVRQWRFEVWNEPNLDAFWTGTQEDYWNLYRTAAEALKGVDSQLQVGGPASAEAGWIDDFLDFVDKNDVPADFLSTHAYPQNEFASHPTRAESPHAPGMYFPATVRWVRERVRASSRPNLPIYWTEWSALDAKDKEDIDWYANSTIDELYAAALVTHVCRNLDADSDGLFWWVASDIFEEMGLPQAPFSNTFGMVTIQGVPKASFHAFRLLAEMRGPVLSLEIESPHPGASAVATQEGKMVRVLLWNHVPRGLPEEVWEGEISVPDLAGRIASSLHVKRDRGSAYEAWRDAGESHNSTSVQEQVIAALSTPEGRMTRMSDGDFAFRLEPGEVMLVEFGRAPDPKIEKGTDSDLTANWNDQLHVPDSANT